MQSPAQPGALEGLLKKQFPTVIGVVILVVALVAGLIFMGTGPGVFAPRATPQTTPKKVKVTNLTDTGFTVSFLTDELTPGFVKYGEGASALNSQISDDRDHLSGTVGSFGSHHIPVRGLSPGTSYFYLIGTGSGATFDNNGAPFSIKTLPSGSNPNPAKTAYGTVNTAAGSPAAGAVVYVSLSGAGEMSSLVKDTGSWAVSLSNARNLVDGSFAAVSDQTVLSISVQGTGANQVAAASVTVAEAQPVATLTLGGSGDATPPAQNLASPSPEATSEADQASAGGSIVFASPTVELGGLGGVMDETEATGGAEVVTNETVDLAEIEAQVVTTSQPTITGTAAPSVKVNITINSDTEITQEVVTDADGNFELDLAQLGENLEPGEHTVTYSYTDPTTGEEVIKTQTFFVSASGSVSDVSGSLASATTGTGGTSYPYGTSNPYPFGSTASATATRSGTATSSATISGRSSYPATGSAVPKSGAVGTTLALILGGFFFIGAGAWSYYLASRIDLAEIEA